MGEGYRPDRFSEGDGGREERAPEPARRDPWSAALGIRPVRLRDYELPDESAQPDHASPERGDSGTDPHADQADPTDQADQGGQADQGDEGERADHAERGDQGDRAHQGDQDRRVGQDDQAGQPAPGLETYLDQLERPESGPDDPSRRSPDHLGNQQEEPTDPGSRNSATRPLSREGVRPAEFAEPDESSGRKLKAAGPTSDSGREAGGAAPAETTHPARPRSLEESDSDQRRSPETTRDRPGTVGPDGIRRFATDTDGEAYGEQVLGTTFDQLDPAAQKAVYEYTRDSWPYNSLLRSSDPEKTLDEMLENPSYRTMLAEHFDGSAPGHADVHERISLIDGALTSPLPESLEVRRGLRTARHMRGYGGDVRQVVDATQSESAYMSTSLGGQAAFAGPEFPIQLHLQVPAGYPALWIGSRSHYSTERELLLPRNTSYLITDVQPAREGWNIFAKVVTSEPSESLREDSDDG